MNRKSILLVLVLVLAIALVAAPAFAKKKGRGKPMSSGNVLLGGGSMFHWTQGTQKVSPDDGEDFDIKETSFGLEALAGYFVIPGLEVGGVLEWDQTKTEIDDTDYNTTDILIGPQAGYFYPVSSGISIFGLASLGYVKTLMEIDKTKLEHAGWFFEPRGGATFHLNSKVGIFAALFFRYSNTNGELEVGNFDTDVDSTGQMFGLKAGVFGFL